MKAILCLGVLVMLAGCDGSRVELESTKATLGNVTRERDDFKVQVATLQQQLTTTKAELAKAKAAEPPPPADKNAKPTMASKSSPPGSSTASKNKHAHKS
jgi:hypothetical protein